MSTFDHKWRAMTRDDIANLKTGDLIRMGPTLIQPGLICEVRDLAEVFPQRKDGVRTHHGLGAFPLKSRGNKSFYGISPHVAHCWELVR